ncbi:hypothetical protein GCM10010271_46800 [Streptomyces kurssanovii]|nr:hypothetical protein GCM10010271_46800 [Streptomyces kurssanovii]
MLLGVADSFAGQLFCAHRDTLVTAGCWLISALGVAQVLGRGFDSRPPAAGGRETPLGIRGLRTGAGLGLAWLHRRPRRRDPQTEVTAVTRTVERVDRRLHLAPNRRMISPA